MAGKRVAIFGGSFSPPGIHHRRVVEALLERFDEVIVVPCGPRPDKPTVEAIPPVYRAAMADIAFRGLERVDVQLFDLEHATFARTHHLEERFSDRGELWHVVGADLVTGGATRTSVIHRVWEKGPELWSQLRFALVTRPGHALADGDLPPRHELIELDSTGSSTEIRDRRYRREPIDGLVGDELGAYIERHNLYRVGLPAQVTRIPFGSPPALMLVADEGNPKAMAWRETLAPFESDEPSAIMVIGGDGTMLRAIHTHWRRRLPFFGLNAGHLGFLLNDSAEVLGAKWPPAELVLRQMPLLFVEVETVDGDIAEGLSFTDAWLERASGQSAWLELAINGRVRLDKIVGDGALVSTAAGSTAYARAMGATPLLAETPAWLVVGSNVTHPPGFKSALLSIDSEVELRNLDPVKRPVEALLAGASFGNVTRMTVRISRTATAELGFVPEHDMAEKIARMQFPNGEP